VLLPYLRLIRAGTLFSPAADVVAGLCLAGGVWTVDAIRAALASVAIYGAGMVLNDHADRARDAVVRAGVADRVTRPEQARALWRHWGHPRIEWTPSGHVIATLKKGLRPFLREIVAEHLFEPGQAPFATAEARQAS